MNDMPTSPVSTSQTGDLVTGAPAASIRGEWRRFGAFLKRPNLDAEMISASPLTVLLRIFALDALFMFALILAASIAVAAGVYLPETSLAGIEFTLLVILGVVVAAPVFEELFFRGWLSGRPGPVIALFSFLIGAAGFGLLHVSYPLIGVGLGVIGIGAGIAALLALRGLPPFDWFRSYFPFFFWLATLSFALVHLGNFDEGSLAILLPLVLPQFILGTMVGYVRVRIGLWAAIVLHALHNATALALAGLASLVQG